jgi:hypothetical protein
MIWYAIALLARAKSGGSEPCLGELALLIVDLATMKRVRSMELSAQPFGIYFHEGTAYINCLIAGTIERLSLATWTLDKPFRLTMGVDGMGWMDRHP